MGLVPVTVEYCPLCSCPPEFCKYAACKGAEGEVTQAMGKVSVSGGEEVRLHSLPGGVRSVTWTTLAVIRPSTIRHATYAFYGCRASLPDVRMVTRTGRHINWCFD
jgi:hypothetical protein